MPNEITITTSNPYTDWMKTWTKTQINSVYGAFGNAGEAAEYCKKDVENTQFAYERLLGGHWHLPSVEVKKVIFNDPATIIQWNDGSKTVVKCQNGEPFDAEKGFVMAYLKKLLGNDNTFNKEIAKWVKYDEPKKKPEPTDEWRVVNRKARVGDYIRLKTNGMYPWNEPGEILKVDEVVGVGTLVRVLGKNHIRTTDDQNRAWNYLAEEYEVVEKVEVLPNGDR